jgi:2-oxoglutarate dehydrogenase E2 component (dihydrolipoamide succinyltransferase)
VFRAELADLFELNTMAVNIVIPEMGESVRTGVVSRWLKADGEAVARDEVVLELETDKINAEVTAPAAGRLKHLCKVGETVAVGASVGQVEEGAAGSAPAAPAQAGPPAKSAPTTPGAANGSHKPAGEPRVTPLAQKVAAESGVDLARVAATGVGGRVREQDVKDYLAARTAPAPAAASVAAPAPAPSAARSGEGTRRERLSPIRARIAERLVNAQHTAAMLTTFNEVDMSAVMALRGKYKEDFEKKHGVGLGFMSFFVKAAAHALQQFPTVNAYLAQNAAGDLEVEHHDACHIAVAVSTPKGLTVPVLRNAQSLSFAQIESGIKSLATRAREGKLTLDDLQGGTFTITNGGIFGSLVSTPILNAPQSAILGMHAIKNRPVEHPEKPGEIALRPMMYLALSYDHRLLDGSEAVQFLVSIKNSLERPERLLIGL